MKILHIEAGRHIYGGAFQVKVLLEELSKSGVENILVCPSQSAIAQHAAGSAAVEAVPMKGDLDFTFPFRLIKLFKKHHPDIVHVHSRRGADFWGGLCARYCDIPAIMTRRVAYREWGPLMRFKCRHYRRIIGISDGSLKGMKEAGVDESRMGRIYDAVNGRDYRIPADRKWFEREFGAAISAPVIGVPAQLIESKGHRYVLEAAARLVRDIPELKIIFLGQGAYSGELEKMVSELHLESVVQFAGFRNDMPKILPCLDVVILPSLMEGLGVSLLQASACGVPVIGTRVGGVPEAVRDGLNGIIVEPGDSAGIYTAARKILTDKALAQKMGSAGKRLVKDVFAPDVMAKAYLEEYQALLAFHL